MAVARGLIIKNAIMASPTINIGISIFLNSFSSMELKISGYL